jgi:hypothetical protein
MSECLCIAGVWWAGLMKKAMELSILCDCNIAVLVFSGDKLFQYSSEDMDEVLRKYHNFDGHYEALTNNEVRLHARHGHGSNEYVPR